MHYRTRKWEFIEMARVRGWTSLLLLTRQQTMHFQGCISSITPSLRVIDLSCLVIVENRRLLLAG